MGKRSCLTAISLAGVMAVSFPAAAMAASPEFARSEEEWESLRDHVLEYGEIPDLIAEYNATVQSNQYEYRRFINKYGKTREDIAESYRELADDLESSMTGDDGMGMISDFQLELQARQMREMADDTTEDSQVYYLTYCQVEDSLAMSAQSWFISYYRYQLEFQSAQEQLAILENQAALTASEIQAGIATQADGYSAQEAVINRESYGRHGSQDRECKEESDRPLRLEGERPSGYSDGPGAGSGGDRRHRSAGRYTDGGRK